MLSLLQLCLTPAHTASEAIHTASEASTTVTQKASEAPHTPLEAVDVRGYSPCWPLSISGASEAP